MVPHKCREEGSLPLWLPEEFGEIDLPNIPKHLWYPTG